MMKKVLYGVALTLLSGVCVGSLQSCKDDINDITTQTSYNLSKLKSDLLAADAKLQEQITANRNDINTNTASINKLLQDLNDYATIKYVDGLVAKLEQADKDLAAADEAQKAELKKVKEDLENQINGALSRITALESKIDGIATNKNDIEELKGKVAAQQTAIEAINEELPKMAQKIAAAEGDIADLQTNVTNLQTTFTGLENSVNELWYEVASFREEVGQLAGIIQDLVDQYDSIETELGNAIGRINALITGILVQGTDSPVFGNFSLPLGIQSNILFNWFGYNDIEAYQFPNAGSEYNYNQEYAPVISQADLNALAPAYVTIPKGYLGDVNLGKLYLTINPAGHVFNEEAFTLETSAENAYPATLKLAKSNEEMYFGYSRSTVEGNGFYEADVIVSADDIKDAKIEIQEGLKSAAKDALKDPSKRTAVNLIKGIYGQVNNTLPSYAVRYNWTSNGNPYSVLSNYALAATTAKPLSYSFLYGKGTTKRLRTFGHLDNLIERLKDNQNLKFEFESTINFDNVKIELGEVNVSAPEGKLTITIPSVDVYDAATGELIGSSKPTEIPSENIEGMADITDEIAANIESALRDVMDDLNRQLNDDVLGEIKAQVDNMVAEMNKQINGKIENIIDDFSDKAQPYFDRINKVIDLYNKVAGKINNFLADPNHYLQVAMFYNQANSQVGILSNTVKDPTIFTNGNGWIALYASSYTGEIVAPAYKKYVAISNVYDAKTKKSLNPSAADLQALNAKGKFLNEVKDGNTIRFGISASSLEAGKIYEIVYQGVDYSGRTSTQKFYIQVK